MIEKSGRNSLFFTIFNVLSQTSNENFFFTKHTLFLRNIYNTWLYYIKENKVCNIQRHNTNCTSSLFSASSERSL